MDTYRMSIGNPIPAEPHKKVCVCEECMPPPSSFRSDADVRRHAWREVQRRRRVAQRRAGAVAREVDAFIDARTATIIKPATVEEIETQEGLRRLEHIQQARQEGTV